MVGLKILSDCKRVALLNVWLPTSKLLIFIGVALYITNSYAFTETEDATINADLVLNGVLKKGSTCKANFTQAGTLCISSTIQGKSTLSNAIKACGDQQARVCTHEDIIYACMSDNDVIVEGEQVPDNILLGNYGNGDWWIQVEKARFKEGSVDSSKECTANYTSGVEIVNNNDKFYYYCCY